MLVATAGHIDHGKTALVRALTGVETDRLPEERARGISIDLGFAYAVTRRSGDLRAGCGPNTSSWSGAPPRTCRARLR